MTKKIASEMLVVIHIIMSYMIESCMDRFYLFSANIHFLDDVKRNDLPIH